MGTDRITLNGSIVKPSALMGGVVDLLESNRLARLCPWEALIERASSLEDTTRPSEETDLLYKWDNGNASLVSHPVDDTRRTGQPRVHRGPIGGANILLKDPHLRDQLRKDCGIIAVEMEGSGVADAAWNTGKSYLVIRGICDYCDPKKNDIWQGYAAVAAAAYARAVISSISLDSYKSEQ